MVLTKAAPVCFSQDLFSLFDFLKIMIVIIVGTIFKIRRNFRKRSLFNCFFQNLLSDILLYRGDHQGVRDIAASHLFRARQGFL